MIKMTENLLDHYKKVLIEDLQTYLNGLDENDVIFSNILSNRIITNSVILQSETHVLLGVILKEITYDFRFYKESDKLNEGIRLVRKNIRDYMNKEVEISSIDLIEDYYNYYMKFRELVKNPLEKYEENASFSLLTTNFCLDFYIKELEHDDIPINLDVLVFGVLNEINRVMRNHGITKEILMLKLILTTFGRMHEYYRFFLEDENTKERWNESYNNFKAKLIDNLKIFKDNQEYIENSINLLYKLGSEWRYMFIRLLELPKPPIRESQVSVPNKVKEDLNEIVSELIDSKLKEEEND